MPLIQWIAQDLAATPAADHGGTGMYGFAIPRIDGGASDGIHLVWSGPPAWGYSLNGYAVLRRAAEQIVVGACDSLSGTRLSALHADHVAGFAAGTARYRIGPSPSGTPPTCAIYRLDLAEPQPAIDVTLATGTTGDVVAIALRDGKAIVARTATLSGGAATVQLRAPRIDRVVIYGPQATALTVCVMTAAARTALESWTGVPALIHGLQLPIAEVNPAVGSPAEELALARSRMVTPSDLPDAGFTELAQALRDLVGRPGGRPIDATRRERQDPDDRFQDTALLGMAFLPSVDPDGRRALGIAHLDRAALVLGQTYDYRITGTFPEIDLHDTVLGFQSLPPLALLPTSFHLGRVLVTLAYATPVHTAGTPPAGALTFTSRRAIRLQGAGTLASFDLPDPVTELTLEQYVTTDLAFTYSARPAGVFLPPITGSVPATASATLTFPIPIDRLELSGKGSIHALRLHGITGPARDPARRVTTSIDIYGVTFAATSPPPPPLTIEVENLQRALAPAPVDDTVADPPHRLGFRVRWRPAVSGGIAVWPPDLDARPPLDHTTFVLQRMQVTPSGPWLDVAAKRVGGSRGELGGAPDLPPGADLLALFDKAPDASGDLRFELDDPLTDVSGAPLAAPGKAFRYRVASVDPTGRQSTTWTTSGDVMLEKHQPPPQPIGPAVAPDTIAPAGVHGFVIDSHDPEISPADLALCAGHDHAVVLRWRWTAAERARDPYATEMRVYFRATPGTELTGKLIGPVVLDGTRWRGTAHFDRIVAADEVAGLWLRNVTRSFHIAEHGAGTDVTIWLDRLKLSSSAPVPADFRLVLPADGAELRPGMYGGRVAIVAIDPMQDDYQYVAYDALPVDAATPRRIAWIGVSAADAEGYVADALPGTAPLGGRPGNESPIATRVVARRRRQRPILVPPTPLADVPEHVTDEPAADRVQTSLDLPAIVGTPSPFAPGEGIQLERLATSDITRRMRLEPDDSVTVLLPDDTRVPYAPIVPADRVALAAELTTGDGERVEGRFVRDVLIQLPALQSMFAPAGRDAFGAVTTALPAQAERWLYRVRRTNEAGALSDGAVLLDVIVRVPSLRAPGAPTVAIAATQDDHLRATVRVRPAFDLGWVLLFHTAAPIAAGRTAAAERADLLRVPNRRDDYPDAGIRLRRSDGGFVTPHAIAAASGVADGELLRFDYDLAVGHGQTLLVYVAALSRDGIPSRIAGPLLATTAPEVP